MPFQLKRVQEPPTRSDGVRILVDRLWPRGISKERAHLDEWNKVLPPSNELRKAFHGGEMDYRGFVRAYRKELGGHADELDRLRTLAQGRTVTLLFAASDTGHNNAEVLLEVLTGPEKGR